MNYRNIASYGIAGLMFLGSYMMPMLARAQTATNSIKQQFFDTIVDYAKKQGLNLNRINEKNIEIKSEVKIKNEKEEEEEVLGLFNRKTRKMQIKKLSLENIATIGIHEFTHEKMYDVEESELWFKKIPYDVEKQGDTYIVTMKEEPRSLTIPKELQKLIIKDDETNNNTTIYDTKGDILAKLDTVEIFGGKHYSIKIKKANYEINGLQGAWYCKKEIDMGNEKIMFSYEPSEITQFYNELIARIYEQIFSGYYHGRDIYATIGEKDKNTLGKSLAYLTSKYSLTPQQQKISKNIEEAYNKLNEEVLAGLLEKTLTIGGKTFKGAMEDVQDDRFSKSLVLASVILPKEDFKIILDLHDKKGKDEVIQLLSEQVTQLEKTKKVGALNERKIIKEYLKKFNLNDEEAEYVMRQTKHTDFNQFLNSKEKIKHIERIKQRNLEKLLESFKKYEAEITKGL